MHEIWLQKYIKEHSRQIGFASLHGPYSCGPDFKGVFEGRPVKIEAEWEYADYLKHKHPPDFADILVVATLEPVPPTLKEQLPPIIIHLMREQVGEWAGPRMIKQNEEDYHSYPWRKFARNLLDLYAYYRQQAGQEMDFPGSSLLPGLHRNQKPAGFQFAPGGREEGFAGPPEDKAAWDCWLEIAHSAASHFRLKPALLRPTWIDRVALYFNHTGRVTEGELKRFQEVGLFIDDLLPR
jgi:hypothetical protein